MILEIRNTICFWIYSIIGIFLPVLKTSKAILTNEAEVMMEQLTYWIVITVIGMIRLLCRLFGAYKNAPPELLSLFVLWLTQPQWGGYILSKII